MIRQAWFSPAAIAWMQSILQERFGIAFKLEVELDRRILVSLPGYAGAITLPLSSGVFTRTDSNLPCGWWDAEEEGWSIPLRSLMPTPGCETVPQPLIESRGSDIHIHYDLLGLIYWMLSRCEEVGRVDLDQHGRFPAVASHAFKHGYLDRPVADEWLSVLGQVMLRMWPEVTLKAHHFRVQLSHDVDMPSLYGFAPWRRIGRMMAGHLVKRRDVRASVTAPWVKLGTQKTLHEADPFNTFDWIMDLSESQGLKSAFYFICGRTDDRFDADYEIGHPAIRDLMKRIHARGHEIGLHPSYGSFQSPELVKAEFQRLRQTAEESNVQQGEWGGRMHYLRWEHPTTLRAWDVAGLDYDSTLGYADRPGFRCGTCYEYPAFDPVADTALRLRVRPLIAMESTVIDSAYLGLGLGQAAQDKFARLRAACRAVGGCFTLLWHNSSLTDSEMRGLYASAVLGRKH